MGAPPATAPAVDERVERLGDAIADAGLEAFVATSAASIAYLTGYRQEIQLERLFAVLVRPGGRGALVVPRLDEAEAAAAPSSLERVAYDADSNGIPELLDLLRGAARIGVEEDDLSYGRATALEAAGELVGAGAMLMGLRARKDAREVERIRHACGVVGAALEEMFGRLRVGDVEREVNAEVEHRLRRAGASDVHSLILFGPNGANPHGSPGDRPLEAGDVICADASACIDGYWGDLTRCGTAGPPSDWAGEAWETVHEAYEAAVAATRTGAAARDVDAAQREVIEGAWELGRCLHGAGHAIGAEVHEPPFLVPSDETPLAEGMVFTVEPGLYRPGTGGIRLEDDVLVTAGEPALLSSLPLELRQA